MPRSLDLADQARAPDWLICSERLPPDVLIDVPGSIEILRPGAEHQSAYVVTTGIDIRLDRQVIAELKYQIVATVDNARYLIRCDHRRVGR